MASERLAKIVNWFTKNTPFAAHWWQHLKSDILKWKRRNYPGVRWLIVLGLFEAIVVVFLTIGLSKRLLTVQYQVMFVLSFLLIVREARKLLAGLAQAKPRKSLRKLRQEGHVYVVTILAITFIAVALRVPPTDEAPNISLLLWFAISLGVLCVALFARFFKDVTSVVSEFIALTVRTLVRPWVVASLGYAVYWWAAVAQGFLISTHAYVTANCTSTLQIQREIHGSDTYNVLPTVCARIQQIEQWDKEGKRPRVAVALSGGGYRAAAVHAGVLDALETAAIPVRYISTVSGGSILGTAYAEGLPAEEFVKRLQAESPALHDELLNFVAVLLELLSPSYSSTDTLSYHFARVFFHNHLLRDSGPPKLIINATSYEKGKRQAYWSARNGDLPLAKLVAASGAFPGVFKPIRIDADELLDGGVAENLGVEGLEHYFRQAPCEELPHILIISNASKAPQTIKRGFYKPSSVESALRASELSYAALHQYLLRFYGYYLAGQDFHALGGFPQHHRIWRSGCEDRMRIYDLDPLAAATDPDFHFSAGESALIAKAAVLPTLSELNEDQLTAAFWVGRTVASRYIQAICRDYGLPCEDPRRQLPVYPYPAQAAARVLGAP